MPKTTGVEIDGTHVRVVQVNGSAASYEEFEGASQAEAIASWVKKRGKPDKDTVVCWSGPATMRPVEIPVADESVLRAVVLDAAPRALSSATGMVVSGVVSSDPDGSEQQALIGAVDVENMRPVYGRLGDEARVMLSGFAFPQAEDGVYLAVRASCVDMTQVEGGYINGFRVLDVEGIDVLAQAIQAAGSTKEVALQKMEDYGDRLTDQVRETNRQWARDQRTAPKSNVIYVHGIGVDVPGLREKLEADTGKRILPPPIAKVDLSQIAGQAHKAAQAIFAATTGASRLPAVWLVNPEVEQAKVLKAERDKKRVTTVGIAIVAVAVLAFIAFPFGAARARLTSAHSDYDVARKKFQAVQQFDRLGYQVATAEGENKKLEDAEPAWSRVMEFLFSSVPPGTSFNTVSFRPEGKTVKIDVSVTSRGLAFEQPEVFIREFTRSLGIPNVFPRSLSRTEDGVVSASFDVTLPDDKRFFDSSTNQFPPATAPPGGGAPAAPGATTTSRP